MVYPPTAPMLDLLILSIINHEDSYGYQISQQIKTVSNMKDSALYPVLKRLADNSFVETYDQPIQGRNRKYYRLTGRGRQHYHYLHENWHSYTKAIEKIINYEEVPGNGDDHD